MDTLAALTALVFMACVFLLGLAIVGIILKTFFWIVFFPIRILFKLVFGVLGAAFGLLILPIVLVIAAVAIIGGIIVALLSFLAPLLPVAIVALVGWAIYRASTRGPSRGFAA
jgi:hypothetical protein